MQLLDGLNIKELSMADLTGEWEYKLKQIENGKIDKDTFIKEIRTMVSNIVEKTKSFEMSQKFTKWAKLTPNMSKRVHSAPNRCEMHP